MTGRFPQSDTPEKAVLTTESPTEAAPDTPVAEVTEAAPDAPPPESMPVFVDRSGLRKWLLRLAALLVLAVSAVYICALAIVLTNQPSSQSGVVGGAPPALVAPAGTSGAVG